MFWKDSVTRYALAPLVGIAAIGLSACGAPDAEDGAKASAQASSVAEEVASAAPSAKEAASSAKEAVASAASSAAQDATSAASSTSTAPAAVGGALDQARAAVTAAEKASKGKAVGLDWNDDKNWEIDLVAQDKKVSVDVGANGVDVSAPDVDDDALDEDEKAALKSATVPLTKALSIATDKVPGTIDAAELNKDDD